MVGLRESLGLFCVALNDSVFWGLLLVSLGGLQTAREFGVLGVLFWWIVLLLMRLLL